MAKKEVYGFYGTLETQGTSALVSDSTATVEAVITFGATGRSGTQLQNIKLADDDVVEVELEQSGMTLLMSVDELHNYARTGKVRGDGGSMLMLPTSIASEQGTRGFTSFAIRVLRVLGVNVAAGAVRAAAAKVESWIDDGGPGLYKVSEDGSLVSQPIPTGDMPVLMFIHGTGSSTARAFSGILPFTEKDKDTSPDRLERWNQLYDHYEGRVFALEHKTLTETPLSNVMDFLNVWSADGGPPLVLVSHSRGGVVGDYLSCLSEWELQPPELFDALSKNSAEKKALAALTSRLSRIPAGKRPVVQRHIRVATPAAGTSLASNKTHIWLSMLSTLTGQIPGVGTAFSVIGDLAAVIVKEGLEPDVLPGIDAQKNDSAFIRSAQFYTTSRTELYAITGNSHGALSQALSPIFPGRHDLVVDTHSMLRGPEYKTRMELNIDDDDITHTNYFTHRSVETHLHNILIDRDFSAFAEAQRPTSTRGHISAASPGDQTELPCLFLLPGIMGSELSIEKNGEQCDIWLDAFQLFIGRGKLLQLKDNDNSVQPTGVLERGYNDFVDYVRSGQRAHVVPFGYDWRRSVFDSVDRLEELVQQRLAASPEKPIVFVCHSMGGLVARAWRLSHSTTWDKIKSDSGRMVQLGTPNYGSWIIPNIFRGDEKILDLLAFADIKNKKSDWLNWISKYPGLLQLSDFDHQHADLKSTTTWKSLANTSIPSALLRSAVSARTKLAEDKFEQDDGIVYIAGHSDSTPRLDVTDTANPKIIGVPNAGDGRVLWPSEPSQKMADFYMSAAHGDLLNTPASFDAVIDLALLGTTENLPRQPDTKAIRGSSSSIENFNTELSGHQLLQPSSNELQAAVLGGTDTTAAQVKSKQASLTVSVSHGDLVFCQAPIMVGHYIGDGIRNAERSLDTALGGKLTRRWTLGSEFYAGAAGTQDIALKQNPNSPGPAGAIVIGLGRMGELHKGDLITTVRNGVLRYGQVCDEQGEDCSELKIASLLIGSGQEALELLDVIDAIIGGVTLANTILQNSRANNARTIRVNEIEFIEWHLDVAIRARHLMERLPDDTSCKLIKKPGINQLQGGRTRAYVRDNNDWWESLQIRMEEPKADADPVYGLTTLNFSVLGGNALGIGARVQYRQREISASLEPLLSSRTAPEDKTVKSLFEQLVPERLKPLAAHKRNLIVNLDPASAYLPWEILVDRISTGSEPMAVAGGLLRRIVPAPGDMPVESMLHAEGNTAMIIGNPPSGPNFQSLVGAFNEAESVSELLNEKDWAVNRNHVYAPGAVAASIKASDIRDDIIANDYRVLHFAAHGVHDAQWPERSGVVLGYDEETKSMELFSSHHVRAIRNKPSLVFINCCHTGKIKHWHAHKLSASLAAEFMKAGVHCVIGAGWAVQDDAAKLFAETVYGLLLDGYNFGYAVKTARSAVFHAYRDTNTWAAFQCYGNPGYVLVKRSPGGYSESNERFTHLSELLHELTNLRMQNKAPDASGVSKSRILRSAIGLYKTAKLIQDNKSGQSWGDLGEVLTHMAIIYFEVGEYVRADEFIERAVNADRSAVTLEDLMLVANYQTRRALTRTQAVQATLTDKSLNSADRKKHKDELQHRADQLDTALASLARYSELHQDAYTLEIVASGYKLLALSRTRRADQKTSIRKMAKIYEQSAQLERHNAFYPGTNALLGYVLLKKSKTKFESAEHKRSANELIAIIDRSLERQKGANFWSIISHIDADVVYKLNAGKFDNAYARKTAKKILEAKAHASAGELDSVSKQFQFIKTCAADKRTRDAAALVCEQLLPTEP